MTQTPLNRKLNTAPHFGPMVPPSTHHPGAGFEAALMRAQAAGPGGALRCRPWLACPAPATGRAPAWHTPHQGLPQVPVVGKRHLSGPSSYYPSFANSPAPPGVPYSLYHQTKAQLPNPKGIPCTSPYTPLHVLYSVNTHFPPGPTLSLPIPQTQTTL